MYVPSIPDHNKRPAKLPMHMSQEGNNVRCPDVSVLNVEVDAATFAGRCKRDRTNDRQPIVAVPRVLNRCLSARRPGTPIHRLQHEAGFVQKNEARPSGSSPFFIRGQSHLRQRRIAASSRSRARRAGFWGVQPRSRSTRPTWSTWYSMSNSLLMTCATRAQVHNSVANPARRGPARNSEHKRVCCDELSFRRGPGCGLAASAVIPPSRHAFFQRLTLVKEALTASATSARLLPFDRRSAAMRRRTSSSAAVPFGLITCHTYTTFRRFIDRAAVNKSPSPWRRTLPTDSSI